MQWKMIADPGVVSSIPACSHTFVEIDNDIFSTVILLLKLIQERLFPLTSESICTNYWLSALSSGSRKKCVEVNLRSPHDHSC